MVQTALPVVLRDSGVALDTIGYLSVLFLPWALKFLWAPLVDRFGTQRGWIISCQSGLILCFALASFLPPATHLLQLSAVLMAMALIATTQDVATDSLGVHATTPETRGEASGASTGGGYLGFLIGGGLWLPVYSYWGWSASMWAMAVCIAIFTIPTLAAARLKIEPPGSVQTRPSLRAALSNKVLMRGLGFMVVYQCGVRLGISMTGPFLVDAGISVAAIGWIKGAGGAVAGILAALAGAAVTQRFGAAKALAAFAALNLVTSVGLAAFALGALESVPVMVALLLLQGVAVAMSFVALYAAMMNWCAPEQVATDFAILQSLDAILAILMGSLAGLLGQYFGYAAIFGFAALLLGVAIWRSFRLDPGARAGDSASAHNSSPAYTQESVR